MNKIKKSIRSWIIDEYDLNNALLRKATRIVSKLNIGDPRPGRVGILLTEKEWHKVREKL